MNNENNVTKNEIELHQRLLDDSHENIQLYTKKLVECYENVKYHTGKIRMLSKIDTEVAEKKMPSSVRYIFAFLIIIFSVTFIILHVNPYEILTKNIYVQFSNNSAFLLSFLGILFIAIKYLHTKPIETLKLIFIAQIVNLFISFFAFYINVLLVVEQSFFSLICISMLVISIDIACVYTIYSRTQKNSLERLTKIIFFLYYAYMILVIFFKFSFVLFFLGVPFQEVPAWISAFAILGGFFKIFLFSENSYSIESSFEKSISVTKNEDKIKNKTIWLLLLGGMQIVFIILIVWYFFGKYTYYNEKSKYQTNAPSNKIEQQTKPDAPPPQKSETTGMDCSNKIDTSGIYIHIDSERNITICSTTPNH